MGLEPSAGARMNARYLSMSLAICILAQAFVAHAEIYTYTAEDGSIVFTNIPPKSLSNTTRKKQNTFDWTDKLGVLRKVHGVDISKYDAIIIEAAQYYTLPPALVKAMVAVESSFEPTAISPAGAQGLMQLMPPTAKAMLVHDVFDPRANVFGGARYLRLLTNDFKGDIQKTVAAYNAGPGAVKRYKGIPNYPETQKYVRRVLKLYRHYLKHWPAGKQ